MKTTLTLVIILFNASVIFSNTPPLFNGDLTFVSGSYSMGIEMKVVSLPFEGVTNSNLEGRYDSLFNGSIHKRFFNDSIYTYPIYYHQYSIPASQHVTLSSCMAEDVHANNTDAWGMAKYKITLIIGTSTPKTFYFYWNSLDTAYGKIVGGIIYKRDWEFTYDQTANGIIISGDAVNYDTLHLSENGKEYKVWELLLNRSTPVGRNFYARTTPFGITPEIVTPAINSINELILGTTVILDTVYNNFGNSDRKGYNTIDTNGGGQIFFYFYYSYPPIDGINDKGNTFCTPAKINTDNELGLNIIAENGDTLILRKKKKLWISGQQAVPSGGDSLFFKYGSKLILEQNAEIFTCFKGGLVFEAGSSASWNNSSCVRAFPNSGFNFSGSHTINNGGFIVIDGNANLNLGDSTTLTFDGSTSYLDLKPSSQVKLGQNAKIVFKNGAYLRANGATFSQTSSGKISSGLVFENSGLDSIVNCTFSNVKTAITIKNDSISLAGINNNIIRRNTFNISQTYGRGLDVRNVFNLLLDSNTFNFTSNDITVGVYFRNTFNTSGGGGASGPASSYSLNITRNKFDDGYLPLYLSCLAAERTPFYVYKNEFEGENQYSIVCLKISGDIKENILMENNPNSSIGLWNCNANIFRNTIHSGSHNMYLNNSFPNISPLRNEHNQNVWRGGRNEFESAENENILISNSLPNLQMGKNKFTVDNNSSFHLDGSLTDTSLFYMQYNCWGNPNDTAKFHLYKYTSDTTLKIIPAISIPKWCDPNINYLTPTVVSKGNGIYDTTQISSDMLVDIDVDEALLIQARSDFRREYYPDAITNYKGLIDNYTYSGYLFTSLSELYDCYKYLDTTEDETTRDILYGDFKQYLEDKILANSYDTAFEDVAYEFILICDTKMEKYEIALTGYEFMALYHPDAEQRMLASWDYEDINDLLGEGEGGSISNYELQITNEEKERVEALYELREFNQFDKKINDDPILKRMKKRYEKTMASNKQRQEKAITTNTLNSKLDGRARQEQSEKLISRAKDNIMRSKYLSSEEKEVRRLEDMEVLFGKIKDELQTDDNGISQPMTYSLSQNYPNPFNPMTKIDYELPITNFVSIKIYDLLGKEVMTLVNEKKNAGSYSVDFNGVNLSSGVYFYRMESSEFVDIKRMILIK